MAARTARPPEEGSTASPEPTSTCLKLEQTVEQVQELSKQFQELSKQVEEANARYFNLDERLDCIERTMLDTLKEERLSASDAESTPSPAPEGSADSTAPGSSEGEDGGGGGGGDAPPAEGGARAAQPGEASSSAGPASVVADNASSNTEAEAGSALADQSSQPVVTVQDKLRARDAQRQREGSKGEDAESSEAGPSGDAAGPGASTQQHSAGGGGGSGGAKEEATQQVAGENKEGSAGGGEQPGKGAAEEKAAPAPPILSRSHVYQLNRLQSTIAGIMNSGYIESIKQLRETLLISEWDLSNRHLAKRRAIAAFERYVVEHKLHEEAGGFEVLSKLYEDPDAYETLLVSEPLRMLARSMMEESMSARRMEVYVACTQTASEIARRELSGSSFASIFSLKEGLWGILKRVWGIILRCIIPFKLPFKFW